MSGTGVGGSSKHNFSSKRKKRRKQDHRDCEKKDVSHSGMSRGNSSVSEESLPLTQPPPTSSLPRSEHSSKKSFSLKCEQKASFSKKNMSFKAVASSSCSKKDLQEGAAVSDLLTKNRRSPPGYQREHFKGSSKESHTNKGKYLKKGITENSQSRNTKERTELQHNDKSTRKGKKLYKESFCHDVRHIEKSIRENKSHRKKRTHREGTGSHSSRSHSESNSSTNVSVEVSFGNSLKRQDGQRNVPQSHMQHEGVLANETSMKSGEGSASHSTRVRKIPGFYYDQEKKRYFKILPGHIVASSWITSDNIKEKAAEEKRRNLLKQQNPPKVINGTSLSAVNILRSMQEGVWNHTRYTRYSTECRVQAMNVTPACVYEPSTDLQISGIAPVIQFVELDRSMSKVMVVLSSDQLNRIILGSITGEHGTKKELLLQEWQDVYIRNSTSSRISSAKLINIEQQDNSFPGSLYVLFSWSGDYSNAVQLVKCPSEQDPVSYIGYRFESPGEVISSCSWSSNPRFPAHLCIGFSKEAEVIEILSSSRQRLNTEKKEVLSQVFAKEQPVIYLGLKQACISSYDLRAPHQAVYSMVHKNPVKKKMTIDQGGCVCTLRLLKDENYLVAGSSDGTIKVWDLRHRAVVKEMYGHCNEYKSLPVNVDSTENFVYSVGQDHHTRLWSLQDSNHLKTIPSPVPRTSTTSAFFSINWGSSGLPGLMIGATNKLFWYPF